MCYMMLRYLIFLLVCLVSGSTKQKLIHCRDPDLGGQAPTSKFSQRKFLIISGSGGGLGNYLLFYPAAYYFAALTGRDILIQDGSLFGEMCSVLQCGFPLYSEMAATFPSVLDQQKLHSVRGIKAWDMMRIFNNEITANEQLLRADGYKYQSGWYMGYNHTLDCISHLTGCEREDVSCHDRHALQRLVRGPFKSQFRQFEEERVVGVPPNLKHGLMTLPHAYAPRLDACIHLRCQFKHFEAVVDPGDIGWADAVKEVDTWLNSTDFNAGIGMFRAMEAKIMAELHLIVSERNNRRRLLVQQYNEHIRRLNEHNLYDNRRRGLLADEQSLNSSQLDYLSEHSQYKGDANDRIYVYLASDNERVKEALANYLLGHTHISVMRVRNVNGHIVHAKNVKHIKENENNTGVMNLVLDWYSMSLSNVVFAWRRDTDLLSTFAQSAQRVSGNIEQIDTQIHMDDDVNATAAAKSDSNAPLPRSRGFQLVFKHGRTIWRDF